MNADANFDTAQYLERIHCSQQPELSFEFLRALHHAQLYTIPFENFDICLNRGIKLEPSFLFKKLVCRRRGGYCFELNGLLLRALRAFGFDARAVLGRVHVTGVPTGRSHQVSLVNLDGTQWILDVGFGAATPRAPIPLKFDAPFDCDGDIFRLVKNDDFGIMLQCQQAGEWGNLYSFDLAPVCPGDIEYGNYFTSTHPSSLFVNSRVAVLPTERGIATLFNLRLRTRAPGAADVEEQELEEGPAYIETLQCVFGIDLDARYDDLKPLPRNNEAG